MERLQVLVALKRRNRFLNLTVPLSSILVAGITLAGLFVGGGMLGWLVVSRLTGSDELTRLARENASLRARLDYYAAAVDTFQQFIAATEQMDNRFRAAMNLSLIPSDIRLLGIGGKQPPAPEPRVDNLLRRVRFEQQSLAEIAAAVRQQEARLKNTPSIWPVPGWVTSGFGFRCDPFTGRRTMHEGIDIVAPTGSMVVASADGRVVYAGWKSGWGRVVEIDHGFGVRTFYGHCRSLKVNVGDRVTRGQMIATVGSSGRATGVHLHYGVMVNGCWVNPRNYIVSPAGS
ncbi:MAG: M23 family metallopeptidase [candidate division WOR-3 bacterium]